MEKTLILSDVDGTIIKSSLLLEHGKYLEKEGVMTFTDSEISIRDVDKLNTFVDEYVNQLKGKTEKDLYVDDFCDIYLDEEKNYWEWVVESIRRNKGSTLLISGSPDFLVKRLAEKLGEGVSFVASTYLKNWEGVFTGNYTGVFNGITKQVIVDSLELSEEGLHITAFGNSEEDLPLLKKADKPFLVTPTEELLNKAPKNTYIVGKIHN